MHSFQAWGNVVDVESLYDTEDQIKFILYDDQSSEDEHAALLIISCASMVGINFQTSVQTKSLGPPVIRWIPKSSRAKAHLFICRSNTIILLRITMTSSQRGQHPAYSCSDRVEHARHNCEAKNGTARKHNLAIRKTRHEIKKYIYRLLYYTILGEIINTIIPVVTYSRYYR